MGGTGVTSCAWVFGDGTTSTECSPVHSYRVHGEYSARFWTNDSLGATGGGVVRVGVAPSLLASLGGVPPAFAGQAVGLSVAEAGGVPPYSVAWSFGDGGVATGASVQHSYGAAGTYATQATVTDAVGGRSTVQANLTVAVDGSSLPGNQNGSFTIPSPTGSLQVPLELRSAHASSQGPWTTWEMVAGAVLGALAILLDRGRSPSATAGRRSWITRCAGWARTTVRGRRPGVR